MNDDFDRQFAAAQGEMAAAGISPMNANPPFNWLTASLGLRIRPPMYQPFALQVVFYGGFFGVFWGLFMYLFLWRAQGMDLWLASAVAAGAGLAFGLGIAALNRRKSKRHGLTAWQDL